MKCNFFNLVTATPDAMVDASLLPTFYGQDSSAIVMPKWNDTRTVVCSQTSRRQVTRVRMGGNLKADYLGKTVTKFKKKVSGVEQFEKQQVKIFTKEAGWLRKEPDF